MKIYVVALVAVCEEIDKTWSIPEISVLADNEKEAIDKAAEIYYKNYEYEFADYVFTDYWYIL